MNDFFQKESLFKSGKVIKLEKGAILHTPLEDCSSLGFVKSGKLRLTRILSSGKQVFLQDFSKGDIFAELIVFSGEKYPGWLIAEEHAVIVELELEELIIQLNENNALLSFLTEISRRVSNLRKTIEILSFKTIRQKVAYFLLPRENLSEEFSLNVTALADRLGCTREALSRALSQLVSENIISREKNSYKIVQQSLLEDILFE